MTCHDVQWQHSLGLHGMCPAACIFECADASWWSSEQVLRVNPTCAVEGKEDRGQGSDAAYAEMMCVSIEGLERCVVQLY